MYTIEVSKDGDLVEIIYLDTSIRLIAWIYYKLTEFTFLLSRKTYKLELKISSL